MCHCHIIPYRIFAAYGDAFGGFVAATFVFTFDAVVRSFVRPSSPVHDMPPFGNQASYQLLVVGVALYSEKIRHYEVSFVVGPRNTSSNR